MQDLSAQILSAINISQATAIVTAAGLALIGLAFVSFVLRQGSNAAAGRLGERDNDNDDEKERD